MSDTSVGNKRIARNTMFMYIRSILILFVSLYTSRVLLKELGQIDFGVYNIVAGFVTLLTFLNTAMVNSTQRFLNCCIGEDDHRAYENYFRSSILIQILFSLCLLLFAETVGLWFVDKKLNIPMDRHNAALVVYHLGVLSFIIKILQAPFSALIVSKERMNFFALQGIIESLLLLVIVLGLSLSHQDKLKTYAVLLLLVSLIILSLNVFYAKKIEKQVKFLPLWDKYTFVHLLAFSSWNILGSISTIAKSQGLNIILNIFFNVIVNAARGIAGQVFSGVSTFIANFQTAFKPQLIQSYAEGNYDRYEQLTFWGTKMSAYIMWLFTLPIILTVHTLLALWLGDNNVPEHTASFTIIALLTGLVDTYASPMAMAVSANGNIKKFQIWVSSFKILILPIAYVMCMFDMSPELVLSIGLILDIFAVLIRLYLWKKVYPVSIKKYSLSVIFPTLSVFLVTYFLCSSIAAHISFDGLGKIIIISILTMFVNVVAIIIIGLRKSERENIFKDILRKIMK